jgi:hypothetical protein
MQTLAARFNPRMVAAGGVLLVAAFLVLAFFDRAVGGVLFLVGLSLFLDGLGQFHPLFGLLFPLLALLAAITDATRGIPDAALRWFLGAFVIFAVGLVLRRQRVAPPARPNPALESLTAELAALKAQRDRGNITDEEFHARRDAAVSALRSFVPEPPPPQPPSASETISR